MTLNIGFNFRQTVGFVTDIAPDNFVSYHDASFVYPTTVGGASVGWSSDPGATDDRNRNAGLNARLAGIMFRGNSGTTVAKFRVDLPDGPGTYDIRLAVGDDYSTQSNYWRIFDNTTVLSTFANQTSNPTQYYDATGVLRTSASDWVTNNAALRLTFASSTFFLEIADPSQAGTGNAVCAHLDIVWISGLAGLAWIRA